MNQYVERKLNEEKSISEILIDHIAFDAKHQRYIATGEIELKNNGIINCSDLKCSQFNKKFPQGPVGVCVQPHTNNVLICMSRLHCVQIFDSEGTQMYDVSANESEMPYNISCDTDGSFVVADPLGRKLTLYTANGKKVRHTEQVRATSICYMNRQFSPSASATLLLGGSDFEKRILVFNNDASQQITKFALPAYPHDMCVDMNGYVCVTSCSFLNDYASMCVFEPRMNYAMLQKIVCGTSYNKIGGLCVNDVNEIAIGDPGSWKLRFLD